MPSREILSFFLGLDPSRSFPSGYPSFVPTLVPTDLSNYFPKHVLGECTNDAPSMASTNILSKQLRLEPTWTPTGMPSGDRLILPRIGSIKVASQREA
eukprot:scaffold3556_cov67-Attheya_sp.AAC.8